MKVFILFVQINNSLYLQYNPSKYNIVIIMKIIMINKLYMNYTQNICRQNLKLLFKSSSHILDYYSH